MQNLQTDKRRLTEDIRHDSQTLHKVECRGRIQTSGRIVPALNASTSSHHLSDADALPLASRDATYEFVADKSSLRVRNVQHAKKGIEDGLVKFFTAGAW